MRTVSFQGAQLTASDRRNIALRQRVSASFLNSTLQAQTEQAIVNLEQHKASGAKPIKVWFVERDEKGTPCFAELFGF